MSAHAWQAVEAALISVGLTGVSNQAEMLQLDQRGRARKSRPISAERLTEALAALGKQQSKSFVLQAVCCKGSVQWRCLVD